MLCRDSPMKEDDVEAPKDDDEDFVHDEDQDDDPGVSLICLIG